MTQGAPCICEIEFKYVFSNGKILRSVWKPEIPIWSNYDVDTEPEYHLEPDYDISDSELDYEDYDFGLEPDSDGWQESYSESEIENYMSYALSE